MEELRDIIARMVDAGESEENIKLVVEAYKAKNAGKTQTQVPGAPVEETAAPDMESKSEEDSSASWLKKTDADFAATAAGITEGVLSLPSTLYDIAVTPFNALGELFTGKKDIYSAEKLGDAVGVKNKLADYYAEEQTRLEEKSAKIASEIYESEGIIDAISEGNYGEAFERLANGFISSIPFTASLMLGGAYTKLPQLATGATAVFMGPELRKQREEGKEGLDAVSDAFTIAAAETVFSSINAKALTGVAKDIIKREGVEAGKEMVQKGLMEGYKKALRKFGAVPAAVGEGIEEVATLTTQNLVNDMPAFEGVGDAFIQGAFGGGVLGAPINIAQAKENVQKSIASDKVSSILENANYDNIIDVFKQPEEIDEATLNVIGVKNVEKAFAAELNKRQEAGELTTEEVKNLQNNFNKVSAATKTVNIFDINNEAKQQIASLLVQKQDLQKRINFVNDKALSAADIEKVNAIDESIKDLYSKAEVAKTVSFAEKASEQLGTIETVSEKTTKDLTKTLLKQYGGKPRVLKNLRQKVLNKKVTIDGKEVKAIDYIGGVAYGNKIYINEEVAAKTGQLNVGAHEILHPIINTKIKTGDLGNVIEEFKNNLSKEQRAAVEKGMTARQIKPEDYNSEYLNVFSDLINSGDIKFNEGLFNQIGDFIVEKILRPLGFKQIGFKNGAQVYQFMKEYQKGVKQGELTEAAVKAVKEAPDMQRPSRSFDASLMPREDIDAFGKDLSKEDWDKSGADEAIAELYMNEVLERLMASRITEERRRLPGFSEEDFINEGVAKLITHIRNFNPEKNDSLYGWINSQLENKAKQVLKEGKVTEKTFASQVDEGKVTEEIDDYDQYDEIGFEFDMVTDDGVLINPLDFIGDKAKVEEFRNKIKDAVNGIDKIDNVTFKTLEDLVPEITESVTGIPVKKLTNPKANITTGEIKFMQKFIYDNADKLIKLLPEGAVLEAASEKLIGTGTGVPRKLLQYFYNKNPRITKGAGLSPFEKMPNINKKEFLSVFGINEDGSTLNFGGQDQRAQTIFALGRLVGKLMTNTAVRQELEVQQINRNVIVDVGAGRSEFQLSQMPESITTYKDAHNEVINKHAEVLKKDFGLTDQQINELLDSGIGIWEKRNKKEAIWNRQGLIDHYNFVGNFMAFLPPSFIKNRKTFIVAALGYHARENGYGVDWKKTPAYKVLEGDRGLSIGEILNDRIITIDGKQYDVFSREGRDGLLKINNGTYSQETIEALDALEKLESKAKGGLFAKRHTSAVKIEYSNFGLEETRDAAQALFDKDQATLATLQNKAFNLLMQDFIASQDNKFNALLQAKKIYSTSSSVANGLKSAVTIGGVIFDPKGNYHFEHAYSALEMNRDIFENLILNKKMFKKPEAWFIPVDMKNELDATEFKTANRNDFVKEMLRKAEKDHVITPDNSNFNLSIAPTLETMTNNSLNEMVSDKLNINEKSEISEFQAKRLGKNRGKFKFFIPYSADDFMGLMYYMVRKGKQGDADLAFINDNLIKPFAKGQAAYEEYKQGTLNAFRKFKKSLRKTPADLKKEAINGLTNEQAIRVYIWNNLGYEIPGLSKSEINQAVKYVKDNDSLLEFSKQIQNMLIADFPMPQETWTAGSLTIDVLEHINETARKEFFKDFIAIAEETFGKTNNRGEITGPLANKLRAAFGDNYIEALSDVLYRMKNGRAREFGRNRLVAQLENYINGSIGTIMFFNTRSALLQQLSLVNFINFSDNNPLAAAAAFADQKQFWKDYAELFNSDFLKQRRSGLKIDVNADDIARAAESSTNKAAAALSALLKAGYLPTQMADSHAISFGGATFYRNRINSLMKDGMSEQEAKDQAFMEFKEIAEENQQSSRPDKISAQQASTLGRLFLAFGNTPMQYARLTKKAAIDLINNRGDWKTNTSKLLYYGIVQNIVFTTMQQGLFALAFDPEEDEEKEESRIVYAANSAIDGFVRGFGYGGAIAVTIKNMIAETMKQYSEGGRKDYQKVLLESATISPAISSKLSKLEQGFRTFTWKQELEKVKTEGISLDNPAFEATGKFVSATTNIPLDRVIRKADNVTYSMRHNIETWQAIALMLGYGKWEIGLQEKTKQAKNKKPKVGYKKKKSNKKKI